MTTATTADLCAELILHLGRLGQQAPGAARLTPAQWTALRFFARANRFSRTPSAFSSFHATTRGTASQTVKSLVSAGYLTRKPSETDGRSSLFELTEAGRDMLAADPLKTLSAALERMPDGERAALDQGLRDLLAQVALDRGAETFGTCGDCRFLDREAPGAGTRWVCSCTAAGLISDDFDKLCVNFAPAAAEPDEAGTTPAR